LHYEDKSGRQDMKVKTRKYGYAYGVIRILDKNHPSYEITARLLKKENLDEKKVIFFVRDPRDILVSMYYSFGFTHPWSPHLEIRAYQEERRKKIEKITIDDYAIQTAPGLKEKFAAIGLLRKWAADGLLLRYEDMVNNFEEFYRQLGGFVQLDGSVKDEFFRQTRPRETERPGDHKRKGQPGDYLQKLKPDTIRRLNEILENTLKEFGYELFFKKNKT
jgi:hypothetical protein